MKILIISDIHGYYEKVLTVLDDVRIKDFDILVCNGDFVDVFNLPEGFSEISVADIVLQKLLAVNMPMFCVPGNHDPYEIIDLFNEYDVNLHNTVRKFNDMVFVGFGGAPTPFNTIFEPPEEEIKESLSFLGKNLKPMHFILVVHNPPKDTKLDKTVSGKHVGSQSIKDFIVEKKPLLTISAHIHEAGGIDKIGKTTIFYPGPVYNGFYGIVDIKDNQVDCEIKRVKI